MLDCRSCGACCFGGQWVPVEITDELPDEVTLPGDEFYPAYMRMRCVCLRGTSKFTCAIYAKRPAACRDFEVGSEDCLAKRCEMYGDKND